MQLPGRTRAVSWLTTLKNHHFQSNVSPTCSCKSCIFLTLVDCPPMHFSSFSSTLETSRNEFPATSRVFCKWVRSCLSLVGISFKVFPWIILTSFGARVISKCYHMYTLYYSIYKNGNPKTRSILIHSGCLI